MIKATDILSVQRLPEHEKVYPEIKDPSIVAVSPREYKMYASIGRSTDQQWIVGRFTAPHPAGPWQEISPAKIVGIAGPQLCAPAVVYSAENGKPDWTMFIQTACFIENGVIAEAHSDDGEAFTSISATLIAKEHIEGSIHQSVVGVYDAGVSEVTRGEENLYALIFSGYRTVGSGDLYLSTKKKNDSLWSPAKLILAQEDVPFHNRPGAEDFEWGLEGGKIIQASEHCFLLIAVCFLPLPKGSEGQRQRVFFAVASELEGPYIPLGTPFQPQAYETGKGEHGHPDTLIIDNDLWIIYQERKGEGYPWHLRYVVLDYNKFVEYAQQTLMMYPFAHKLQMA